MGRPRFFQSRKAPVRVPSIIRHTQSQELILKLIPHQHLQSLVDGRGGENEFLTLVFRLMVGASLITFADDREPLKDVFAAAVNSLVSVGERYQRLQKFGTFGDELLSLKAALNLTDDMQVSTTKREQAEMYKKVESFVCGFDHTLDNLRALQRHLGNAEAFETESLLTP